jgi:hypothetical protein
LGSTAPPSSPIFVVICFSSSAKTGDFVAVRARGNHMKMGDLHFFGILFALGPLMRSELMNEISRESMTYLVCIILVLRHKLPAAITRSI